MMSIIIVVCIRIIGNMSFVNVIPNIFLHLLFLVLCSYPHLELQSQKRLQRRTRWPTRKPPEAKRKLYASAGAGLGFKLLGSL